MSKLNIPRVPLHMQNNGLAKSSAKANPSFESFRDHVIHKPEAKAIGDSHVTTHQMSLIRRYADGRLDFDWAKNMVLDAIHNLSYPHALQPLQRALLTILFPDKYKGEMSPQEANMKTQFSNTEKAAVRAMVAAALLEEENWNAGAGGSSIEGRHITRS